MTEHHSVLNAALRLHRLEGQQCPKGLAGTGPGMNQHITPCGGVGLQPSAQQLNQLLLPLSRANGPALRSPRKGKGRGIDGNIER